jgi:hypothetical protein
MPCDPANLFARLLMEEVAGEGVWLARIFHTRSGFSLFSGKRYASDGLPGGFSALARRGSAARAKSAFFSPRGDAAPFRREPHAGFGVRRPRG